MAAEILISIEQFVAGWSLELIFYVITPLFYFLGISCAISALWRTRTPQGTAAWLIALVSFPFVAVPLFLIFGRNRFIGYIKDRKEHDKTAEAELAGLKSISAYQTSVPLNLGAFDAITARTVQPGFLKYNKVELLLNGEQTFSSMFAEIEAARHYILIQFYIFKVDEIGIRFIDLLIRKANSGVRVYLLCDKVGSSIDRKAAGRMSAAGIQFSYFFSVKGWFTHIQINFRNHRKNVVIDGKIVFVGGHNVGDEYLGNNRKLGAWRDTHVKLTGPGAMAAQVSFMKDWYWIREEILELEWPNNFATEGSDALVLHTGPADHIEACSLAHLELIKSATNRIWMTTPYFVPPEGLINALTLAVLRGVEVKIIVPGSSDNRWIKLASKVYLKKLLQVGVQFYQYDSGFLHQKTLLIDDEILMIGSMNLDSRSFFLNFEIAALVKDRELNHRLELALREDMLASQELSYSDMEARPLYKELTSRAISLLAPML